MAMINTTTRAQQPSVSGERKIKEKKKLFFFLFTKSQLKTRMEYLLNETTIFKPTIPFPPLT